MIKRALGFAFAVIIVACATAPRLKGPQIKVTVHSDQWYTSTVYIYCESGRQLGTIRQLNKNEKASKNFSASCMRYSYAVRATGGRYYVVPHSEAIQPGETLHITLGPTLNLTHHTIR